MVSDNVHRTIGLITMECLSGDHTWFCSGCQAHYDATVEQLLIHLAVGAEGASVGAWPDDPSPPTSGDIGSGELPVGRFTRQVPTAWQPSTQLTANLGSLAAELEQALARARRRIALAAA